ncbi:hypothetical protein C0Q70_13779 [Pomacea canaliculata]|uniref:Uncharacterized protein n=1 Tax=Pomacea canaliculata TaxID=400727 RepID=A0A2T7NY80_POMCA|nr:hypothetical protein C0Q70_13779 [Pomacea canaliculata]
MKPAASQGRERSDQDGGMKKNPTDKNRTLSGSLALFLSSVKVTDFVKKYSLEKIREEAVSRTLSRRKDDGVPLELEEVLNHGLGGALGAIRHRPLGEVDIVGCCCPHFNQRRSGGTVCRACRVPGRVPSEARRGQGGTLDARYRILARHGSVYDKNSSATSGVSDDRLTELGRPRLGEVIECTVNIRESQEFKSVVDKLLKKANVSLVVGTSSWREQFADAIAVSSGDEETEEGEEGEEEKLPSCLDYVMHFLTLFWKITFAFVPPTGQ